MPAPRLDTSPAPALSPLRLRRRLLSWYDRNRRELPWREPLHSAEPYRVWISEIMLQQTRVAVVIPYYRRFLERFPDVAALAAAPEQDVLAHWSGLGYYRRARQLHAAARQIQSDHAGRFPRDPDSLRALPGIGVYTIGAVLSIAFQQPLPAVDGNAARIVSRLLGRAMSPAEATPVCRQWLSPGRPGDFNQAVMDLGATICLPRQPRCEACPLAGLCRAAVEGLPQPPPRPLRLNVDEHYLLARRGERVWLRQRAAGAAQLAGLWELPEARTVPAGKALAAVKHAITNRSITARVYDGPARGEGRWMTHAEAAAAPLTGLTRKVLRRCCGWRL